MRSWTEADIAVGDVLEVQSPNTLRPPFIGEVTDLYRSDIVLKPVDLNPQTGMPDDKTVRVTRESLSFPEGRAGRHVLTPLPEYGLWSDGSLMSFGLELPEIPVGCTLEELLRFNNCQLILALSPSEEEWNPARYRKPFYDHISGKIIRQHVTVFALNDNMLLTRHTPNGVMKDHYRHLLPNTFEGGARPFSKIDAGHVLGMFQGRVALGESFGPGGGLRWHHLSANRVFAIETSILAMAGIDAD